MKSVVGGEGHKHSYYNAEEVVQKHHNKKYQKLLKNLQPSDHVSSEPHGAHRSPVKTSKKIKGCVEGQINKSKQFDLSQNNLPVPF